MLRSIVLDQAVSPANQFNQLQIVTASNFAVLLYSIIIYNIMPFGSILNGYNLSPVVKDYLTIDK